MMETPHTEILTVPPRVNSSWAPVRRLEPIFTAPLVAIDLIGELTPLAGKFGVHPDHGGILSPTRFRLAFQRISSGVTTIHPRLSRSGKRQKPVRVP